MAIKEVLHTDLAPAAVGPVLSGNRCKRFRIYLRSGSDRPEGGQDCSNHHRGADRAGYEEPAVRSGTGRRVL